MKTFLFWLGYLWALPVTLVGFVLAVGCRFIRWQGGAALVRIGGVWNLLPARFGAITIGGVVFFREGLEAYPHMVKHELRHFQQVRRLGILFPILYLLCWFSALVMGSPDAYFANQFEADAREAERE